MTTQQTLPQELLPTSDAFPIPLDIREAKAAIPVVMPHAKGSEPVLARFGPKGAQVRLPGALVQLILRVLQETAQGNAVALVSVRRELTTQQAADLLNVSRPYVVRLMEEGRLPFRKVGAHRRIRLDQLLEYRRNIYVAQQKALDAMTAYDQELGLQ